MLVSLGHSALLVVGLIAIPGYYFTLLSHHNAFTMMRLYASLSWQHILLARQYIALLFGKHICYVHCFVILVFLCSILAVDTIDVM